MKTRLALLLLLGGPAAFAAIPVTGPITYTQNFNTLPSVTPVNWVDNSTLSGWWLHRDGTAPPNPASIQVSNGSTAWVANLYSLGATGNAERALGSAPTTNHGTYSFIAIFQNTSAAPVKVNNIKFDVEAYKTNTTTGLAETIQFSRRIAATQAEITSALATGWTNDTTLNQVYPGQAVGNQTRPPDVFTVNRAPGAELIVPPNQHIALRWSNANDGGSDAYIGIDNVEIQFTQPSCSLTATTSGVARQDNGTPGNPNDDTFSFNITVNGFGTGPQGWSSNSTGTPVTGSYGVSKAVTGVPIALSPLSFIVADVATPACTTTVNVTAQGIDLFLTADENIVLSFTAAPLLAQSHVRAGISTEPGFAGGTATANVQFQPPPNNTAKYFDINNAKPAFTTEAINISNVTEFVASIDLAAYTTSDTTFEGDDALTVTVQTANLPAGPWTNAATILNATDGVALFNQIKVSSSGIGFGAGSFPAADFPFVKFRSNAIPRGAATYARLATTGGNNSASEHLLYDNITFAFPRCAILVTSTVTRNNQGDGDPANDTFTASAKIRAELNQGSTGWLSDSAPAAGTYDPVNPVLFGPYPISSGPQTVTFTDNLDPTCTLTVIFSPPPTILAADVIDMLRNDQGTLTLNDDTISFRITMTAQNGGPGWTSNIPVPGAPGTVYSGNYGTLYSINAEVAALPDVLLIIDSADPTATLSLNSRIPSPRRYVIGDFLKVGAPPELVPSVEMPPEIFGKIPNAWQNLTNGVITLNNASDPFIYSTFSVDSDVIMLETVGQVDVTAELVVIDTSPTSNFESNDTFQARIGWQDFEGSPGQQIMTDAHESPPANEMLNGYTDTVAAPYNNNRLRDEFNRPAPGQPMSGLINHTILLTATIPAEADFAVMLIEGVNDSLTEFYRLQNVHFIERGANPNGDGDGDGITDGNEDIMGTDKYDPNSVLRLVPNPANPAQFTFSGAGGRFYRVYVSDDAADATHLQKWVDAGLGSMQDFGPHTVDVSSVPGVARRFFRVHVMQNDGPWPPTVP